MQKPNIDSADKEFLQQAINCVYEHLDDIKFDQQAFADAMRVSKSTLYRKLKSLSNEGPLFSFLIYAYKQLIRFFLITPVCVFPIWLIL